MEFLWTPRPTNVILFPMTGLSEKGFTLCREERETLEERLSRKSQLPKWNFTIKPLGVF
jgi:hypothetical protein